MPELRVPATGRVIPPAAILLCAIVAAELPAREIYVNNAAGDDRATGQYTQSTAELTGPVRTIGRALRLARGGDQIVLANTAEPYRECIALFGSRHSGSPLGPFILRGNGATLDGSDPVPPDAWERHDGAVFRFRPADLGPQQLFLDGRPASRVVPAPSADRPPKLEPLEWCALGGAIYFRVEKAKLPKDYDLRYARRQTGITLYHVSQVAIVDLVVQGFRLDGIHAAAGARGVLLNGVTARGNARAGVVVGGTSDVELLGCVLGHNAQAQLLTLPLSRTRIRESRLLSDLAPGWVDQGGQVWLDEKPIEGGRERIDLEASP